MQIKAFWIYLVILSGSTYLIRSIPFALFQKKLKHPRIVSFLYYIPYAVLSAMTIPAIFSATDSVFSAAAGLLVAIFFALCKCKLTTVAIASCIGVFVTEFFLF